jgi:hypothetical protein
VTDPDVAPLTVPGPSSSPVGWFRSRRVATLAATSCLLLGAACSSANTSSSTGAPGAAVRNGNGLDVRGPVIPGWDCQADCDWVTTNGDRATIEAAVVRRTRGTPGTTARSSTAGQGEHADGGLVPRLGVVDDNASFQAFVEQRRALEAAGQQVLPLAVDGRQIIKVVDTQGRPVLGASIDVTARDGATVAKLTTYADGRAVFAAPAPIGTAASGAAAYTATITKGAARVAVVLNGASADQVVALDGVAAPVGPLKLDVVLVVDTTGSMADELARLQRQIGAITTQVAQLPGPIEVRFGLTVYRDRGDAYVARTYALTPDPAAVERAFAEVTAAGGGDTREDVQSAMRDALTRPGWSPGDAIRLLFLLGDAAPHLDYGDGASATLETSAQEASELGIKIIPIGAQGLDDQGELVFRQLAQATLGRYVYLNGGPDGIAAGAGDAGRSYDRLALDDLIVRLVADEVATAAR